MKTSAPRAKPHRSTTCTVHFILYTATKRCWTGCSNVGSRHATGQHTPRNGVDSCQEKCRFQWHCAASETLSCVRMLHRRFHRPLDVRFGSSLCCSVRSGFCCGQDCAMYISLAILAHRTHSNSAVCSGTDAPRRDSLQEVSRVTKPMGICHAISLRADVLEGLGNA